MILYRAMCREEMEETLKRQNPFFFRIRFKWFSASLVFIRDRVRDGLFFESGNKPGAYEHIIAFEIIKGSEHISRLNIKEWMLDARKVPQVKFGRVWQLPAHDFTRLSLVEELQARHKLAA